jgi:hypothetical protein
MLEVMGNPDDKEVQVTKFINPKCRSPNCGGASPSCGGSLRWHGRPAHDRAALRADYGWAAILLYTSRPRHGRDAHAFIHKVIPSGRFEVARAFQPVGTLRPHGFHGLDSPCLQFGQSTNAVCAFERMKTGRKFVSRFTRRKACATAESPVSRWRLRFRRAIP